MHTSKSACYFVDALRCVRSADQNMAVYNRPLGPLFFPTVNFDKSLSLQLRENSTLLVVQLTQEKNSKHGGNFS